MEYDELIRRAVNNIRLLQRKEIKQVREDRSNYDNENAPVVELVNKIIEEAINKRASDIHLEPEQEGLNCRLRIDGQLNKFHAKIPNELREYIISRIKVISGLDIALHNVPQDGRLPYKFNGEDIDIRVSVLPLINGEKIVMRILNDSRRFVNINQLEFSEENKEKFLKLIHIPFGAVIVAGPVNSGKTTSLYAAIKEIATGKENIITIEDPVEYKIAGVNQMQVNNKTGLTLTEGLRASLRQDSDLIMLGEIRDEETANIAIRAALTGHLLFTTLHTASAAEAIFRLLDMGIKGYMISAAVKGVVAQRLVRRLCPKCRKLDYIKEHSREAEFLGKYFIKGMKHYLAAGCEECDFTGYRGRLAIQEIMIMNDDLGNLLRQQTIDLTAIRKCIHKNGMKNLFQDALLKVQQGKTTLEEVQRTIFIN